MKVFVDTSALYALLAAEDAHHQAAQRAVEALTTSGATLVTTNYILLECASLLQKRHGFSPAKTFLTKASATMETVWVDERLYREAIAIWTKAQSRQLSLVDCTSFSAMQQRHIRQAFAFDSHFTRQGFEVIP